MRRIKNRPGVVSMNNQWMDVRMTIIGITPISHISSDINIIEPTVEVQALEIERDLSFTVHCVEK